MRRARAPCPLVRGAGKVAEIKAILYRHFEKISTEASARASPLTKNKPSYAVCPTQRTHAIGLWVTQHSILEEGIRYIRHFLAHIRQLRYLTWKNTRAPLKEYLSSIHSLWKLLKRWMRRRWFCNTIQQGVQPGFNRAREGFKGLQ
jgi:hypothetical protein